MPRPGRGRWQVWRIAGWPSTVTRVAGTSHCTVTHGCGTVPGPTKAQPATVKASASVAIGCPLTVTRAFAEIDADLAAVRAERRRADMEQEPDT